MRHTGRRTVIETRTAATRASLMSTGLFRRVEVDRVARASATVNDPLVAGQWHLARIQAAGAWDVTTGSITVAVIDSGAHPHPDLTPNVVPGWNFIDDNADTSDKLGHGTAVAGTIAAAGNNATGVAGAAWGCRVMPLVVLNEQNVAWYSDISDAIRYAADAGCRIINISIGGPYTTWDLESACAYAWARGCVIFASAMNTGSSAPQYPAAHPNVVAVGATTPDDARADFSCWGAWLDLAAPGTGILTTTGNGSYAGWNGTSFASPLVAAVAALALSARPTLTNAQLVGLLRQSSDDLGPAGFDPAFGWGRVNALRAVSTALQDGPSDVTAPAVVISSPG